CVSVCTQSLQRFSVDALNGHVFFFELCQGLLNVAAEVLVLFVNPLFGSSNEDFLDVFGQGIPFFLVDGKNGGVEGKGSQGQMIGDFVEAAANPGDEWTGRAVNDLAIERQIKIGR